MSKTFFPELSELVSASHPHSHLTQYKVGIGMEEWNGSYVRVVKVQVVYNGIVSGRRSPSYPIGSDDYLRVNEAIARLIAKHSEQSKND
jgi:hypothetical protein